MLTFSHLFPLILTESQIRSLNSVLHTKLSSHVSTDTPFSILWDYSRFKANLGLLHRVNFMGLKTYDFRIERETSAVDKGSDIFLVWKAGDTVVGTMIIEGEGLNNRRKNVPQCRFVHNNPISPGIKLGFCGKKQTSVWAIARNTGCFILNATLTTIREPPSSTKQQNHWQCWILATVSCSSQLINCLKSVLFMPYWVFLSWTRIAKCWTKSSKWFRWEVMFKNEWTHALLANTACLHLHKFCTAEALKLPSLSIFAWRCLWTVDAKLCPLYISVWNMVELLYSRFGRFHSC
jgi:hypothetical protein